MKKLFLLIFLALPLCAVQNKKQKSLTTERFNNRQPRPHRQSRPIYPYQYATFKRYILLESTEDFDQYLQEKQFDINDDTNGCSLLSYAILALQFDTPGSQLFPNQKNNFKLLFEKYYGDPDHKKDSQFLTPLELFNCHNKNPEGPSTAKGLFIKTILLQHRKTHSPCTELLQANEELP